LRYLSHGVALAILLAFTAAASAGDYGFKGINLGSHVSQVATNPKYDCKAVTTPTADRICGLKKNEVETMAGVPVASVFYFYDQTVLTGINIGVEEKHFQAVVAALTGKYGAPTQAKSPIKNLKGEAFENLVYTWRAKGESIVAERYSGRIDRSSVRIAEDAAAQRIRARREAVAREPGKDL
jgi:hypothetical protein